MPKINKDICIACGTCESICPDVFELKSGEKANVKDEFEKDAPCIEEAINSCPVQAISK